MTPYGYKIENNKPVKSTEDATRIYAFFKFYAEGRSVSEAMEAASLPVGSTTAKQMLRRNLYTGTEGYPPIIPSDLFAEVQSELSRRTHAPTRKKEPALPVHDTFRLDALLSNGGVGDLATAIERLYSCVVPDKAGSTSMTREEKKQAQAFLASAVRTSSGARRVS